MPLPSDEKLIQLGDDLNRAIRHHFWSAPWLPPGSRQGRSPDGQLHPFFGSCVSHTGAAHRARFYSGNRAVLRRDAFLPSLTTTRRQILVDSPFVSI